MMRLWAACMACSLAAATEAGSSEGELAALDCVLLQHDAKVHQRKAERSQKESRYVFDETPIEQPFSTTYASIKPAESQAFVEQFMGVSRKPMAFGEGQDKCAEVTFLEACLDTRENTTISQFDFHFVNGFTYPMGPMSIHDLYTYVERVLSPMDKWNDFMQPSSGYLVRNLTLMWQSFHDAGEKVWLTKSDEHGPYTIWAMVPGGIVYTYTSFVLDPKVAARAVLFRQPCDPPAEMVYQLPEEVGSWKNHSWPSPHSFLPFYSNVPVYDPAAEVQHLLDIMKLTGSNETWTVRQQEGCMAIKRPGSLMEYRFELPAQMNSTRTETFPYLYGDFLAYVARVSDSFQWKEWNAWADKHHVIMMGLHSAPYDRFVNFEAALQKNGLPYLKRDRAQFDTFFVLSSDQTTAWQFKFLNDEKRRYKETMLDPEIPGCTEDDAVLYDWYSQLAKSGVTAQESVNILEKKGYIPFELLGDELPYFNNSEKLGEAFNFCQGPTERFNAHVHNSFECQHFENLKLCLPS